MKDKKVSQPLYLTKEQREYLKEKATAVGLTMNAYIVMLINKDMGR